MLKSISGLKTRKHPHFLKFILIRNYAATLKLGDVSATISTNEIEKIAHDTIQRENSMMNGDFNPEEIFWGINPLVPFQSDAYFNALLNSQYALSHLQWMMVFYSSHLIFTFILLII